MGHHHPTALQLDFVSQLWSKTNFPPKLQDKIQRWKETLEVIALLCLLLPQGGLHSHGSQDNRPSC